mmetsp:Transcript_60967/g.137684  ORF Transcript_60967/g.137684 Transcript_60967/m.137684 type:complete len:232 (+) Transcript_60967:1317-2012(+)
MTGTEPLVSESHALHPALRICRWLHLPWCRRPDPYLSQNHSATCSIPRPPRRAPPSSHRPHLARRRSKGDQEKPSPRAGLPSSSCSGPSSSSAEAVAPARFLRRCAHWQGTSPWLSNLRGRPAPQRSRHSAGPLHPRCPSDAPSASRATRRGRRPSTHHPNLLTIPFLLSHHHRNAQAVLRTSSEPPPMPRPPPPSAGARLPPPASVSPPPPPSASSPPAPRSCSSLPPSG